VTDLIAEAAVAMNLECTSDELAYTIHPHPTISEAMMEAAMSLMNA
jgi:dihydrolipoamide dehydrogenase